MLHAPTNETKTETTQSKSPFALQTGRELHPHSFGAAGAYALSGAGSAAPVRYPGAQRHQIIADMQATHGNQAVLRMMQSSPQMARMTALRPSQGVMLQRKCACGGTPESTGECAECKEKREAALQRSVVNQGALPAVNTTLPIVHDVLSSPGRPLDAGTRAFMEPRFGQDFSQVRAHSAGSNMIQAKLTINQPGDEYEQEADRVADQMMHMPDTAASVLRKCACGGTSEATGECEECRNKRLAIQRRASSQAESATVFPVVSTVLNGGGGRPLDSATRSFMEPRFGYDFSQVRVHADERAAESAQAVNALAYTVGRDVVFGTGQYAPGTSAGKRLLAHELTHVLQQNGLSPSASTPEAGVGRTASQRQVGPTHLSTMAASSPSIQRKNGEEANVAAGQGVPAEKWSPDLEDRYRRVGATSTADAMHNCRVQGGNACGILLTQDELWELYALATSQKTKEQPSLPPAASWLAPGFATPPIEPPVPSLPPMQAPPVVEPTFAPAPEAAAGLGTGLSLAEVLPPLAVAAVLALEIYELKTFGDFQRALIKEGFIILETAHSVCMRGCHSSSPQTSSSPATRTAEMLPPEVLLNMRDWLKKPLSEAVKKPQTQPQPAPQPRTVPQDCVDQADRLSQLGCGRFEARVMAPNVRNPQADIYCHDITGSECEYWLYPPVGNQPLAKFDGVRGRDVIECKCGYDHFLDHPDSPASRGALDKMIKEILSHLRYAQDCGLQYRVFVSSQRLADWIRNEPGLATQVDVIVQPAEECD